MNFRELLAELQGRGISLSSSAGQIRYSAPEGALTPELRAAMRERKAELLEFLESTAKIAAVSQIRPRRRDGGNLPLSLLQEGMRFAASVEGQQTLYNELLAFRIVGDLKLNEVNRAISAIERRHEILRASYEITDGVAGLRIHEARFGRVPVTIARDWTDEAVLQELTAEWRKPFDLQNGPLWRVRLLERDRDVWILAVAIHHSICDDWSFRIFLDDLGAIYGSLTGGQPDGLQPLAIQYADFAWWQRERLNGPVRDHLLNYWREQLSGAPGLLELPVDFPRSPESRRISRRLVTAIPAALWRELRDVSQANRTTPFMTFLAAYTVFLHRYTGQDDIVTGVPSACRDRAEIEASIGLFANTLPIRTRLAPGETFRSLLSKIRRTLLEAQDHQELPFDEMVKAVAQPRNLGFMPIVQTLFTWQAGMTEAFRKRTGLKISPEPLESLPAKFDLVLQVEERDGELAIAWDYDTSLFTRETVARMSGHFATLLAGIGSALDGPVHELPLLDAQERRRILVEWNRTQSDSADDRCVHRMFEEQAARAPGATAIVHGGVRIAYGELNRRANRLAHVLIGSGAGLEKIAGVCMERSIETIVALLAVLKAGAAYLPLDPSLPDERLEFMVRDASVRLLVTGSGGAGGLTRGADVETGGRTIVGVDARGDGRDDNPTVSPSPANLAYVIYTSGSTGEPKGVEVTHGNLTNFVRTEIRRFGFSSRSRVLQFAGPSFDASLSEIFTALCAGGELYLPTPEEALPGPALARLIAESAITHVKLPPSALAVMPRNEYPALEVLMTIGEACTTDQIEFWSRGRRFCNGYGPTEAAIGIMGAECTNSSKAPPIGRPYDNTQVYVLDAHRQPVPVGVAGELYLAGAQIARGYLNRPGLTSEKFLPASLFPFEAEGRLYRTGDLVRYRADGNLDFVGRIDGMVKIRGVRIELGEIEAALNRHELVLNSAAATWEFASGDRRLVAYVVLREAVSGARAALVSYLQGRLPKHMIPGAVVLLAQMPLTATGKIDRNALPAPGADDWLTVQFVAPRTQTEEVVLDIWRDLLKQPGIGVEDNFFAVGGHSLLVTESIYRVRKQLGVETGIRAVFDNPTVAALAGHIDRLTLEAVDDATLARMLDELTTS